MRSRPTAVFCANDLVALGVLLLEDASGDPSHEHRRVVFEPELVVRASTIGNAG